MSRNNMYENRETSRVPAEKAGRSGKAQRRTPDRNAREESDRCIVTDEAAEQRATFGGGGGGKEAAQGEQHTT
jgi:hypothetical protein